jgi:hypothetical protein
MKFCEAYVSGMTKRAAYEAAYPNAKKSGPTSSRRLMKNPEIQAEIARLRALAQEKAGSSVMTLIEKRQWLARIVRARPALLEEDSDLWQSVRRSHYGLVMKLPDKIAAIIADNDLSGHGDEAMVSDSLSQLLASIRMKDGGGSAGRC